MFVNSIRQGVQSSTLSLQALESATALTHFQGQMLQNFFVRNLQIFVIS